MTLIVSLSSYSMSWSIQLFSNFKTGFLNSHLKFFIYNLVTFTFKFFVCYFRGLFLGTNFFGDHLIFFILEENFFVLTEIQI